MYHASGDNIPLKPTSSAYTSVAVNEPDSDSWRQEDELLDQSNSRSQASKPWWRRVGWPAGALGSAIMATVALAINLSVLIWTVRTFEYEYGVAQVYAGNCDESERINTWIHLAINALSTMLLSGSNYCMQILSAPTRQEVDKAHARKKWLDIGVPSVRNLRNVATRKVLLWFLLGLSSIPLHLMYNSVFFATIATNEYDVVLAVEAFVTGGADSLYDNTKFGDLSTLQAEVRNWDRLEALDCINAYATEFLNTRRGLVGVVKDAASHKNDSVKRIFSYTFEFSINSPERFDAYA